MKKVIVRRKKESISALVGRAVRVRQAYLADVNLEREDRKLEDPIFWRCPLTNKEVYYR